MSAPRPTVGRIVHYQAVADTADGTRPAPTAALITVVRECGSAEHSGCPHVSLALMRERGPDIALDVPYSAEPRPGHWNWPPRES